ncbi:MAG: tetratricopeptide repeat protein [Candidatus Brocadiae bacterium]|nr:tetratricopeptide repeat protein [Candidatus Brocadiia bacterium]
MKKFLDDVFCEYLVEKKLLDKSLLFQAKKDKDSITIREKLLLEKYITFSTYTTILSLLRQNRDIIDSQKSIEFDQKFLSYAYSQNLIPKDDIEVCRKHALASPFSTRELLFATSTVDFEIYSQIMSELSSELLQANTKKEDSEQTIIDEENPFPEEEKETVALPLSFVKDNSAETIIDISPPDLEEEEDMPFAYNQSPVQDDESADTVIDQDFGLPSEEIVQEKKVLPQKEELEATLDIEQSVSLKPKDDIFKPREDTFQDYKEQSQHIVSAKKIDSRLKRATFNETGSPTIQEANQYAPLQSDLVTEKFPERFPTIPMDDLIREVQKQVNLQTQQISQNVGKEISSYTSIYKVLCAIVIFIFLFLLVFTGFIEYQRFYDLKILREERNKIIEQKDLALKDKIQAMVKLQEMAEKKLEIEKELDKSQALSKEIKSLTEERDACKQKEKARLHIQMALCYQSIQENERAKEEAKKAWDLAPEDGMVNLALAEYFIKNKDWKRSIKYLETASNQEATAWLAYIRLGEAYFIQGQSLQAKESWEKALKINPALSQIREKLKLLPK